MPVNAVRWFSALRPFRLQDILDIQQAGLENHPVCECLLVERWTPPADVVSRADFLEEIEDRLVFVNYFNFSCVHFDHQN